MAIDFGGVFHWSQYLAAIGIVAATALALPGLTDTTASSGLRQHAILIPLGGLVLYAWIQTMPIAPSLVSWLSPGSHAAYTDWLSGLSDNIAGANGEFPVSVSPLDTAHVARLLTVCLALCLAASIVFHARSRLQMLLSAIAITGASVAVLGFYRKLDPTADLWIFDGRPSAFGGYVNRNNAALMLNLGLAASLGLLSWRVMALHSIELDDPEFEFNDLFALISDRESFVGLLSGTACIAGLLVNGSRGGVVAALFGLMFAFGYARPRRGLVSIPVLGIMFAVSVAILITPMNLNLESINRWEFFSENADTLQSDGRLLHWQDGWRAAKAYLPGGAGMSAYAYAYLPYQNLSPNTWFEHADNLWLEMLVETGLAGVLAMLGFLVTLLIALKRLGYSPDPLDQGIRVAGWYSIAAIGVSQFFDFGLAMPANLLAALLLASAIVSRDIANGGASAVRDEMEDEGMEPLRPDEESVTQSIVVRPSSPKVRLKSASGSGWSSWLSIGRLTTTAFAVMVLGASAVSVPGLRQDATTDSILTRLDDEYAQWRLNPESLAKMEEVLRERIESGPSPLAYARLAMVQRDRGRLAETEQWGPKTQEELVSIYQRTDLQNRELPYPPENETAYLESADSDAHYRAAWHTSLATLPVCPLAQEPRGSLIRLQAVVGKTPEPAPSIESSETSESVRRIARTAAEHLFVFYAGNPSRLFALGEDSLRRGEPDQAARAFHASLECDPRLTPRVMKHLRENPEMEIADVIPRSPDAMRLAMTDYLNWESPDRNYLRQATALVGYAGAASMLERSHSQALLGRMHFFLDDVDKGQDFYQRAIRLAPEFAGHRIELIQQLLDRGMNTEALAQARLGRQSTPQEQRFQAFIEQIAAADRVPSALPEGGTAIDRTKLDEVLKTPER